MPLPMCPSVCNNACLCCGCCGTCCCGVGRERCCSCLNNCCGICNCRCMPCGKTGCLGYPDHLCACCENCNLLCYFGACTPCFVADITSANLTGDEAVTNWSAVMCTLVSFSVAAYVCQQLIPTIDAGLGAITNPIGSIINLIMYIYIGILFGKSATSIAKTQKLNYQPGDCCEACCETQYFACCPGETTGDKVNCCCAYCCCYNCHAMQVSRTLEGNPGGMLDNVMNARPAQCKCCNCWVGALGSSSQELNTTAQP